MSRRLFLALFAQGGLGYALSDATYFDRTVSAQETLPLPKIFGGPTLRNWEVTLGDALFPYEGEGLVTIDDVATIHFDDFSELQANINYLLKQVHNITFFKEVDDHAFRYVHRAGFEFRIPFENLNDLTQDAVGQTMEGGLFVWDGSNTRLDYGSAIQWIISPYYENQGQINFWQANADAGTWVDSGLLLPVDQEWHQLSILIDYTTQQAKILIDELEIPVAFTSTTKPSDWSNTTDARLQAEIISLFPGEGAALPFPRHRMEVRNWFWDWQIFINKLQLPLIISP